jgi:Ca2+-transporting ATPase
MLEHKGIRLVTANPLTGRALVYFDSSVIGLTGIQRMISEVSEEYRRQRKCKVVVSAEAETVREVTKTHNLYTLATGGVLAGLVAKRALLGRSPLAASPQVVSFAALITIVSGYPILHNGIETLAKKKRVNHDLVLFLATLVLLAMKESITGLSVLWIVHLTNLFRLTMQSRSQRSVQKLLASKQQKAWRWLNEQKALVKCSDLREGDIVVVHQGESIPVDGAIVAGKAAISQAAVSGDYQSQLKVAGDAVYAGSQVQAGAIKVRADKVGDATSIAQISRMVSQAQARQLKESPADVYTGKLMWGAIAIAGGMFLLTRDFMRSLAVLLAGCPAAISLARSAALGTAAAEAAGRGIFVKDLEALERAGQADTVLFDKTGTLTTASPRISEVSALVPGFDEPAILSLAASAESSTSHPLARMLVNEARNRSLPILPAEGRSIAGYGVQATIDNKKVLVGNRLLMEQEKIPIFRATAKAKRIELLGNSIIYVAVNKRLVGLIGVCDSIKPQSYEGVHELRSLGIQDIGVVTGDTIYPAEYVAAELGLQSHWNSMLPEDKLKLVVRLRNAGRKVVMVGDGINDSPALAASDTGIAMGLGGTDRAIRTADIVLAYDDPRKVAQTILLSRHTNEVVRQNIALSVGFNVVGMALAAARLISPVTAGLLLNISTLVVILNSGRLLTRRTKKRPATIDLQQFAATGSEAATATTATTDKVVYLPPECSSPWHAKAWTEVCDGLETSPKFGLAGRDAQLRFGQYGPNALQEAEKPSFWKLLGDQFKDFMVQVLIGAAGLSFALGKAKDAMLTVGIVAANAFLGVVQERKASSSLEALKKLSAPQARVIRGGRTVRIAAESLVPGDVILLEAGDRIPADVRLLATSHFEVEESALTGEPLPVRKEANMTCPAEYPLADRRNMVFMGTCVTRGRASAVVVATGMATEMGKIAALIQSHEEEVTPLQRRLEEVGKYLVYGCLGVSGLVFVMGLLRGERVLNMLQTAASLAVAAIPEGLTAIVIIALAMGVQRMSKRNIIVRKLSAIETLGCTTAICSDKTGTLTQNKMTVREIYTGDCTWQVTGEGYAPKGEFCLQGATINPLHSDELMSTLRSGSLCSNAKLVKTQAAQGKVVPLHKEAAIGWGIDGDPTEAAIVVAAAKAGLTQSLLEETYRRIKEFPFESERRMMSVVCEHKDKKTKLVHCKGATDKILAVCTHYVQAGQVLLLDDSVRARIEQANVDMAGRALRVLASAYRELSHFYDEEESQDIETGLIFCGLVGMIDPPRPEVPAAIAKCKAAGVKVIMITGDHPLTAKAIACELGLVRSDGRVVLGSELENMSDVELENIVADTHVYARTSPHQKLRIVKALKQKGYVVAMTGDGVNDAPAVKAADIGIAMGIMGTDVTKQAASMILADDNFATIIRAMEEGRSIYGNIRKAIRYLVATNIGEVVLMLLAAIIGLPLPLIPIQLLWINLIGDGFPAIALVNDPPAKNIMNKPPKTAAESVFSGGLGRKVITRGLVIGLTSVALFAWKLARTGNLILARTIVIAQLAISQFIHIFDCRIEREAGQVGLFSNPWLIGAVALSMSMVAGIIHAPRLQQIFGTVGLTGMDWVVAALLAGVTSLVDFGIESILERRRILPA